LLFGAIQLLLGLILYVFLSLYMRVIKLDVASRQPPPPSRGTLATLGGAWPWRQSLGRQVEPRRGRYRDMHRGTGGGPLKTLRERGGIP
jgi:hypothetical protein